MKFFDPVAKAQQIRAYVEKDTLRKYYRVPRPGRWYGGIATADCCGCNLRCVFCWSNKPRDNPERIGQFYSPEQIFDKITACATRHGYRLLRLSGNEPTLCQPHLLQLLDLVERTNYLFILETNGTLLDADYVAALTQFKNVHVRVSLKGTSAEEHALLTGANEDSFENIIDAIALLTKHRVRFNVAAMLSFSPDKNIMLLKERLRTIAPRVENDFEEEYVFLYPHVARRLKRAGLTPVRAYSPRGIPERLK
ncbi:molybdenum cofactor biosynthesis protein MoaA [candidate division WOR_3 bacterium SM23_60]|uniref:Molybdenum cofactor biosynthesis protein MoaA n=1 Tax=candidate division WOR_3 bacterium SM23_60 TaxID=1703780 RepID=A0A0S8GHI7_UNCW3|nr:MAG: molybdenum cofactor biosynthesis protein MoaA [candidate division WOR_3 bacterium SM23_60]